MPATRYLSILTVVALSCSVGDGTQNMCHKLMIDTNRTFGYKEPLDGTQIFYVLILSLANISALYIKAHQL